MHTESKRSAAQCSVAQRSGTELPIVLFPPLQNKRVDHVRGCPVWSVQKKGFVFSVSGERARVCVEVLRGCVFVWGRTGKEGVMMV